MTIALQNSDEPARQRRFQSKTSRNLAAAGLILGFAGAVTLTATPMTATSAQAFSVGDITGAIGKGVDAATGIAKGTIDAAGKVAKGAVNTAGKVVEGAGRGAGQAVRGAARQVDKVMRNGVNIGGKNIRPACPYFVGCKVDSKGRIVVNVKSRKKTKVSVGQRRPARAVSKLPPPRRESKLPLPRRKNERVPIRKVKGITKHDILPTCKALHCKPGHSKPSGSKRPIGRDKSIWGRPVGVDKDKKSDNVRVRDHRQSKRIVRDHRKSKVQNKRIIRNGKISKRRSSRR